MAYLRSYEILKRHPSAQAVTDWLVCLAPFVRSHESGSDFYDRVRAYAVKLAYPAYCYTEETLDGLAREVEFFPTWKKITEYFDDIVRRTESRVARCRRILQGGSPKKEAEPDYPIGEERRRLADGFAQLISIIRKSGEE